MPAPIRVGSATFDITPPLSIPHLGSVPRQGRFTGVADPLQARAFVFEGEDGRRAALLAVDSIGFGNGILGPGRHFTDEVRARVAERAGLEPGALMLASTHAHSTPETLGITRLLDEPRAPWLEPAGSLASAVDIRQTGHCSPAVKVGRGEVRGVRRKPASRSARGNAGPSRPGRGQA